MTTKLYQRDILVEDTVLFLHIPKAAGSTLTNITILNFSHKKRCPYYMNHQIINLTAEEIKRYRYYAGHFYYSLMASLLPSDFISFTMLRDPVARYISQFYFWQNYSGSLKDYHWGFIIEEIEEVAKFKIMNIDEFVDNKSLKISLGWRNFQCKFLGTELKFDRLEQLSEMFNSGEYLFADMLDIKSIEQRLATMTCFGISERFQDSLFLLCYTFGWRPIVDARRLNVNSNKPRIEEIPTETLQRIAAVNAKDRELYAFAQSLFEQRFSQMCRELLEQYGDKTHACLRLPLAAETIVELLERHYEARFSRRNPTWSEPQYNLGNPLEGASGWYNVEYASAHGAYRWTGPASQAWLDVPRPSDGDLRIRLRVLHVLTPEILNSLCLTVNEQAIALSQTRDAAGAIIFEGRIPGAVATRRPFLRLCLAVERTLAPCTISDNPDSRQLGVALNWIEVMAVSQADDAVGYIQKSVSRLGNLLQKIFR